VPIFSIAPLTPLTPPTPVARGESSADALARAAIIQTTQILGDMVGQSHPELANTTLKDGVGEGEANRAKAAEAVRAAVPPDLLETPARAVAAAAGRAAGRQAGLAPLMADMAQAAAEPSVPRSVKVAIEQVLALRGQMDGQISAPEIRQALQRSGLFLEARLAAAAPGETVPPRQATGTLTAPPRSLPTPTANSDMKAALLVFREVVKTWMDATPPVPPPTQPAVQGAAAPMTPPIPTPTQPAVQGAAAPVNPAAASAMASALLADRGTPQALNAASVLAQVETATEAAETIPAKALSTDAGSASFTKPANGWPSLASALAVGRPAAPPQPPELPTFGAIVADDLPPLPLALGRTPSAAALAYGGPEVAAGAPSQTPPPYAGAPTHAQAAAQPSLPPGSDPRAIAHRLLAETGAALARTELLQIASLPDTHSAGRSAEEQGPRWVFDMPFQTPQGPAVAQFEISRDGGGAGGEDVRQMGHTWRARFSLDVEPMGPVHAQVALTGDRARVSLWAERPASMARLVGGEMRLTAALREAALEPELAFHTGQPRSAAAAPGQFLDQAT
jgi:hypothetical protein